MARLKVNRLAKTEGGEKLIIEIEIPRVAHTHNLHLLPSRKPYTLLEHFDKTGEKIGYMDLRTLPQQDVPEAVQHVAQTNSLILDLRGYTMGVMSYGRNVELGKSTRLCISCN